jgi:drug/metabolite transporter (DMT)-like permease
MTSEQRTHLGHLQIVSAALIWGTYGLFVRALDYSPESILFFRFLFGLIGLLLITAVKSGLSSIKPSLSHWKWMLIPALLTGISWLCYTYAINYTSVASAVFLIYTAPVFTVIFAPLILKEKLEVRTVVALIISLLGTASIIGYGSIFGLGSNLIGDLLALLGGISYGLLALLIKKAPASILGMHSNIIVSGYITLALLPFVLTSLSQFNWKGILILLALGLFQQTFGATLFHLGLRTVKAQHASILTYVEPLAATMMAALFLHEAITPGSLLGGVLIISGGMIIVFKNNARLLMKRTNPGK